MKIQVLLFAQARQIVGSDSIEVTIPDAATVADLKNSLSDSVPELTAIAVQHCLGSAICH
jgi:molybdopterin converting factor small subunit